MGVRRYLIGVLVLIGLSGACWGAAGLDQMAKSIIAATQGPDNASFINDNFAKDVAAKLSASSEPDAPEAVDFDIFTYSQDPDYDAIGKTIKSEAKQTGEADAVIHVTFTQYGDQGVVDYRLKKVGERWVIDDVVYADGTSLRSALGVK